MYNSIRILVTGRVQGVGFRPFVSRLANELGLTGWVRNRSGEVEIRLEGTSAALATFQKALVERAPPLARLDPPRTRAMPSAGLQGFSIEPSEAGEGGKVHVPPDYFVCDDCLAEMQTPGERRYRYPFINCTQCGPRYTLIDRLPYDRPNTAMSGFALCPSCRSEYENPQDRRYHAQPLACPLCGPRLAFHYPVRLGMVESMIPASAAIASASDPHPNPNTVELSRHTGRDRRYPVDRDVAPPVIPSVWVPAISAEKTSKNLNSTILNPPSLPLAGHGYLYKSESVRESTPSPLQGEGWDGGRDSLNPGAPPSHRRSTPTLTLPLPGGGDLCRYPCLAGGGQGGGRTLEPCAESSRVALTSSVLPPSQGPFRFAPSPHQGEGAGDEASLAACVKALKEGAIVAVKGVGGYHLLCDANDDEVVKRLRQRKQRPDKPLAVMMPWRGPEGLDGIMTAAQPEPAELELLKSPLRPIVLMKKRTGYPLAEAIAPRLREVGLMLPYSPLHHLLADAFGGPLVATSANVSGEPVLTEGIEVESRLGGIADAFLHHDRPIRRPADDSVFRRIDGQLRAVRLGRGLAPVERELPFELQQPLLALGADLKNTLALGFGQRVVISPHIGDLGSPRSLQVFEQVMADLKTLYGVEPAAVVCDAHPNYHSGRWARSLPIPCHKVHHHHAHASALAGEHGVDTEMLVFTWDGLGFGEDGTIWGGEALLGKPGSWRRVGSLRSFRLLGGERANREPWRCALALCLETGRDWAACPKDSSLLRQAFERGINSPISTSAGRLFDAAAALTGLSQEASFEGQAAMLLEALSEPADKPIELPQKRDTLGLWRTDWGPLVTMLMDDSLGMAERGSLFHASLAQAITAQAEKIRSESGVSRIGLAGGVFQNRLLTEQAVQSLTRRGFQVYLPSEIPTNDAGISFGQIIELAARIGRSPTNMPAVDSCIV
ncbi:MAG: carbamoyltransferase HypF [Methylococcaceae bacterium]|nr:carbamoyltransferase HypF [Methylococcaceae bacterium]